MATLHLGSLAIVAEPLPLTIRTLRTVAEAMAELGLAGEPPAMRLVEMEPLRPLIARLSGTDALPDVLLGWSVLRPHEAPVILVQRRLPPLVERAAIRHEACHYAQYLAGRLELHDAGKLGRWWSLPAGSTDMQERGERHPLEEEAMQFQLDARYHAERDALERTAPPGWTYSLLRQSDGSWDWELRRLGWRASSGLQQAIDRVVRRRHR